MAGKKGKIIGMMMLHDIVFRLGFGSRRHCESLILHGAVHVQTAQNPVPVRIIEPETAFQAQQLQDLQVIVHGQAWPYTETATIMLHKPAGYECSQKPSRHPSIYSLLPTPLRQRASTPVKGVQAVGRLDQDTTGLLLLTDDGSLIHRLSSPKSLTPKVYEVTLKHPQSSTALQIMCERLLEGVVLDDDPMPVRASACAALAHDHIQLTLCSGKYHQVKRMIAAVGNRVQALHRSRIGDIRLTDDLPPGQWRWLNAQELASLQPVGTSCTTVIKYGGAS